MSIKESGYFTDVFGIKTKQEDLDFFDLNLKDDSKLFLDPFLLKKSSNKKEALLFDRFSDFFRFIYDQSLNLKNDPYERRNLMMLLDFDEPKEVGLGYSKDSSDGSSPGKSFAKLLINFFINKSARELIKEDNLYPDKKFNPITLEIFTDRLGPDGISDITINLIADYLIEYTQIQCKKFNIPMKKLPLNYDGFDFCPDEMSWGGGGIYELPENPFKKGTAIILIPKRLLRASKYRTDENMVNRVVGILQTDPHQVFKFTKMLNKKIDDFNLQDIRKIMLHDHSVFKRYISSLEHQKHIPYDFDIDSKAFFAQKKYYDLFSKIDSKIEINSHEDILEISKKFFDTVVFHISRTDIWRDLWKFKDKKIDKPNTEKVLQNIIYAMGTAYFVNYPMISFDREVGSGNGPIDFKIIYMDFRVAIEVKRLLSGQYLHGIEEQLFEYTELAKTNYAVYITVQHYTDANPRANGKSDDYRTREIEKIIEPTVKKIKTNNSNFKDLFYYNIDATPKKSASKK